MDDHPVHIIQNHHPTNCSKIILAAKWLVRHSSTFPNQQRRPLPSLLYLSFFYMVQGEESSLLECKFNPWREHDCSPAPPVWRRSGAVGHPASASAWMYSVTPLRHECKLFSWGDFRFLVCKYCTPASRQDVTSLLKITIYI